MKNLSAFIPYTVILAVSFYAFPMLIQSTGLAMMIMLLAVPFLVLICAVVYGIKHGFNLIFTLITVLLFTPTIFIFYNPSAWIYIVIYAIISLAGNELGTIFHKKKENNAL